MKIRAKKHRLPLAAYRGEKAVAFTACIEERQQAFRDEFIAKTSIDLLRAAATKHNCRTVIYCFMPDHVHVVLRGLTPASNAKTAMDSFKYESGLWFARNAPH